MREQIINEAWEKKTKEWNLDEPLTLFKREVLEEVLQKQEEKILELIDELILKGHDVPKSDKGYNCHTCDVLEELKQKIKP